jgi:hypothetical protein
VTHGCEVAPPSTVTPALACQPSSLTTYTSLVTPLSLSAHQVTALEELLTRYGPIDRLWWDNYALDGSRYQPVTHEGFVCPGDVFNASTCPAWQVLIDTVRRVSPGTAIIPGPDGCLVDAESYGGTYPVFHATALPDGAYWCAGGATGSPSGGSTYTVVESE